MVFYIAVIIFHNQHESNHISMIFYIAMIVAPSLAERGDPRLISGSFLCKGVAT
jgi:hypothetical protein